MSNVELPLSSRQPLTVGIVGCGLIGKRRATVARELGDRVVAVADVDAGRAQAVALENGCAWTQDWSDVVGRPDVDVIVVTAARELDTVREAMQGGAVSYLIKPFEYQALGERLEHYRRTRSALDTSSHADQQQIDQLFGVRSAASADDLAGLPKGLSRESAQAVRAILVRDEAISATECAQRIGLSRVSARRYLEHLEQTGVAEVALKYGVGRPERRYRLR